MLKNFFCHISPQFRPMTSFCGQKYVFLTVFGQKLCLRTILLEHYFEVLCILLSLIFYSFSVKKWAFFGFLPKFCLISLRGGVQKFFWRKKYLNHILRIFLNTKNNILDIKNKFQTFYGFQHIRGNRFISLSLCFFENSKKTKTSQGGTIGFAPF